MAQAADTGGGTSSFAKFTRIDDTLVGAFGSSPRECQRQARNFDTGNPMVKDTGKPLLEEIMWFVACPGTTVRKGNPDAGYETIEPLDAVRFSVQGYKWGQVIDARKQLPAANGFKAGQACSGDIYTIKLVGWSAETKNPAAATKAGFTVVDGRIVLRSQEDKDRFVLHQSNNGGNTNPAKDFEVTIRRPEPADKAYEQAADEMFLAKPWENVPVMVGASSVGHEGLHEDEEAF